MNLLKILKLRRQSVRTLSDAMFIDCYNCWRSKNQPKVILCDCCDNKHIFSCIIFKRQ